MYLTDSDTIKICWYWPDTDTRIGAALIIGDRGNFKIASITVYMSFQLF